MVWLADMWLTTKDTRNIQAHVCFSVIRGISLGMRKLFEVTEYFSWIHQKCILTTKKSAIFWLVKSVTLCIAKSLTFSSLIETSNDIRVQILYLITVNKHVQIETIYIDIQTNLQGFFLDFLRFFLLILNFNFQKVLFAFEIFWMLRNFCVFSWKWSWNSFVSVLGFLYVNYFEMLRNFLALL